MNDFTKEELEEIAHNLGEIRAWADSLINSWPLLDKIQSMIDNYCEHKTKCINHNKLICEDCGKEWK